MVESFFNLLKRECIRRRKYKAREEARRDVFDYIEFFYNPERKHVRSGMLSPIALEQQQKLKLQGIYKSMGYSLEQSEGSTPGALAQPETDNNRSKGPIDMHEGRPGGRSRRLCPFAQFAGDLTQVARR